MKTFHIYEPNLIDGTVGDWNSSTYVEVAPIQWLEEEGTQPIRDFTNEYQAIITRFVILKKKLTIA